MRPYIGITDFASAGQVREILSLVHEHRQEGSPYQLHVGVMMSYKTLNGLPSSRSSVFPRNDEIHRILSVRHPDVYNCLHYADYNGDTSVDDLVYATVYGGRWMSGLQLDMPWPDPHMVKQALYISGKKIEVILQVGKTAFEQAGKNPLEVVRRLADYKGVIHRVLLDMSMGEGKLMVPTELLKLAVPIAEQFPNLGLVFAGGLCEETLDGMHEILHLFPNASMDAQARLRPSRSALQPLDLGMAGAYVVKALKLSRF